MKKCQDCRANNKNQYCDLGYKTEKLSQIIFNNEYSYISPLEKCDKPKSSKDYNKKLKTFIIKKLCKDNQ
jgi:hypothetical protein